MLKIVDVVLEGYCEMIMIGGLLIFC
jgi:hypothetical protein